MARTGYASSARMNVGPWSYPAQVSRRMLRVHRMPLRAAGRLTLLAALRRFVAMTFLADLDPDEIQARFAWAKRRGLSKWLWPDIHPKLWRAALSDVAGVLGHILSDRPGDVLLDGDPRILSLAAYTSGTGPLLGYFVECGKLRATPGVSAMLAVHLAHGRDRMGMLRQEAIAATRLLADKGIHAIVSKGMHTAFVYFPEPGCRPVSDIDLIVRPDELERAEEIFRSHGYRGRVMSQVP